MNGNEATIGGTRRRWPILLILLGALFFAVWMPFYSDFLRPHNDSESDSLVANALLHAAGRDAAPQTALGCFLPMIPGETATLLTNVPTKIYYSSYGLQGHMAQTAYHLSGGMDLLKLAKILRVVYSFLFGTVLMVFIASVLRDFGKVAASVTWLAFALSPYFSFFGRSLHWQGWLIFLPVVFAWVAYPWALERRKLPLFWGIVAAMVFVRCLVGYEFLSNICLGAIARPVLMHLGGMGNVVAFRSIVRAGVSSFAAVAIGFILAFSFHAKAMSPEFGGSFSASAKHIVDRAKDRTSQTLNRDDLDLLKGKTPSTSATIVSYSRDFGLFTFPNGLGLLATIRGAIYLALRGGTTAREDRARAAAIGVAAVGSFTWVVLAWNHMIVSIPYNMIVFYLPLYLIAPPLLASSLLGDRALAVASMPDPIPA